MGRSAHSRRILLFAATGEPDGHALAAALTTAGCVVEQVAQISQGLGALCRTGADATSPDLAIILHGLSGVAAEVIACAVRGLPQHAHLPLILCGRVPPDLARCIAVERPGDSATLCRLALADPATWHAAAGAGGAAAAPGALVAPGALPGLVLVVDDHQTNRLLIRQQVIRCGLRAETCNDGREACARVAAGGIDLVLMDCQMPVMDGYEAASTIRRGEASGGRHVPIIAVTAFALPENRERCREAGMDGFLAKPCQQAEVAEAISPWLPVSRPITTRRTPLKPVAVFDPTPLRQIDEDVPGTSHLIVAILRKDLAYAEQAFPALIAADDLGALAKAAHKLKGSSGSVGALEVSQACSQLEVAAKAGERAALAPAHATVIAAVLRLRPELALAFPEPLSSKHLSSELLPE